MKILAIIASPRGMQEHWEFEREFWEKKRQNG